MVEVIEIKDEKIPVLDRSAACIGYFDGFHRGHQKLIAKTVELSEKNKLVPTMICFSPDPMDVIAGRKNSHLFPDDVRLRLAEHFGIHRILSIHFDEKIMRMDAEDFIHKYLEKMNICFLVCGYDFSFGYSGKGDPDLLKRKADFNTIEIEEESYLNKKISSTRIKKHIISGDLAYAAELLGFDYCFIVKVVNVCQNGTKWLISGELVDNDCVMPKDGYENGFFRIENGVFLIESDRIYTIGDKIILGKNGIRNEFV